MMLWRTGSQHGAALWPQWIQPCFPMQPRHWHTNLIQISPLMEVAWKIIRRVFSWFYYVKNRSGQRMGSCQQWVRLIVSFSFFVCVVRLVISWQKSDLEGLACFKLFLCDQRIWCGKICCVKKRWSLGMAPYQQWVCLMVDFLIFYMGCEIDHIFPKKWIGRPGLFQSLPLSLEEGI